MILLWRYIVNGFTIKIHEKYFTMKIHWNLLYIKHPTSLLSIGYVVCFPFATYPSPVLWAYASATITEFKHAHRSGDFPISLTGCTCFQHPPYSQQLWTWWHFGNHLVDIILERMWSCQHPLIHSTCEHDDISVITPVLSKYLSTTSAVFTPAGHVNILQLDQLEHTW